MLQVRLLGQFDVRAAEQSRDNRRLIAFCIGGYRLHRDHSNCRVYEVVSRRPWHDSRAGTKRP